MNRNHRTTLCILALTLVRFTPGLSQTSAELRIDPLMLVSLKECRNITSRLQGRFFPGWKFQETPVLFYRPNVQEVLINYPHRPQGFSIYTGFNPLGGDTIYYRNDSTLISIDDQNTSREIDGIPVLVVADPFSAMRSQLSNVVERPKEFAADWLKKWNFIPSPYDRLAMILHEAFHVYQAKIAPAKEANEMAVLQYPLLDPVNNALYVLEGNILRDALVAQNADERLEKIREFVAVRSERQSRLDSNSVAYENLNEFAEGTAKYIEYKFLQLGETVDPIAEMGYQEGFHGYRGVLPGKFREALNSMVNIAAVSDDRFGNKFGSGPLRFRLYDLGACQGLILDEVMPGWKARIFADTVFLSTLLEQAVPLSPSEHEGYLEKAKNTYQYDQALEAKRRFEAEGKEQVRQKLAGILETKHTLVTIHYGGIAEGVGIAFTPFGVTQVGAKSAIYDLVPVRVQFKEGMTLAMKDAVPVLIDRENKVISFAVETGPADIHADSEKKLETKEFVLSGVTMDIKRQDNAVEIQLR